jgi:primosomal protein N' (replication factor Y)
VDTIDLREESQARSFQGAISRKLQIAMSQALDDGGQVILLLNRRGFSTHIQCTACGEVVKCPSCDLALVHHLADKIALCHQCDHQIPAPPKCPACGFAGIRYSGFGTQRLEAEIRARFADYPCLRMDTDTMQGPGSHERALDAFREGEVRILLGTQMIAKGLDFPNVTLVGVVNADTALHLPDFRAAERTFQLLVQVAGRTGRGEKGGRVLIQTLNPQHRAITAAILHDYQGFAREELPVREALGYPPFASLVRIVVRGPVPETANQVASQFADEVRATLGAAEGARVLGPAPAPMAKLRGKFRFQIQAQAKDGAALRDAVRTASAKLKPPEDVEWQADADPLDML